MLCDILEIQISKLFLLAAKSLFVGTFIFIVIPYFRILRPAVVISASMRKCWNLPFIWAFQRTILCLKVLLCEALFKR